VANKHLHNNITNDYAATAQLSHEHQHKVTASINHTLLARRGVSFNWLAKSGVSNGCLLTNQSMKRLHAFILTSGRMPCLDSHIDL
jgi:hypothetical protein